VSFLWLVLGVVAALLFGANAVAIRFLALNNVSPFWVAVGRLYVGAIAIFLILRGLGKKEVFKINNRLLLLAASLSVAANFFLFHYGLAFTTAGSAMVLEATSPIFALLILALVFGDKVTTKEVTAVFVAAVGIVLVVFSPGVSFAAKGTVFGICLK